MPNQPLVYCRAKVFPKCRAKVPRGFCEHHAREQKAQYERNRLSSSRRGYGARWRKLRRSFLNKHPLCVECSRLNIVKEATVVDHIKPHRGNQDLFWDQDNWQALCKRHHDQKTATEEGSWTRGKSRLK